MFASRSDAERAPVDPGVAETGSAPTSLRGQWVTRHHRGRDGSRQYDVYLPVTLPRRGTVPVVLLLHGCRQTSMEFARQSGFTRTADANGFIVVAPRQEMQHQFQRCWQWYDSNHQRRDGGEPAILRGIVAAVIAENAHWRADPRQVYVAGLSAGGAMALILATTYPDVFAAAGVHSATAYRSATWSLRALGAMAAEGAAPSHDGIRSEMAPVVLLHGTHDRVVRPPNADRIVDQWLASRGTGGRGLDRVRPLATTRALILEGRHCIRTRWYTARGRRVLEYWRIDGLGHAWSGGTSKGSFIDVAGPRAAEVMLSFFHRHRRPDHGDLPQDAAGFPQRRFDSAPGWIDITREASVSAPAAPSPTSVPPGRRQRAIALLRRPWPR